MVHIDDFIDNPKSDAYAAWMFSHFRLPAMTRARFDEFMEDRKLFATYDGKRYRVTGASRLGDVWLAKDFAQDTSYDLRVPVERCSEWGPKP
jgi:hypothetical protein